MNWTKSFKDEIHKLASLSLEFANEAMRAAKEGKMDKMLEMGQRALNSQEHIFKFESDVSRRAAFKANIKKGLK